MKIDRLIGILSVLLQREQVTAFELAEKFEVSHRTILRDMDALCCAGIPIVTEKGRNGGIRIMEGYKLDKTVLLQSEMQAILAGLQSLDSISGTHRYRQLMEKLSVSTAKTIPAEHPVLIDLSAHNPKVVTSHLSPIIAKKARSFGTFWNCVLSLSDLKKCISGTILALKEKSS